MPNTMRWNRYL